jgi:hypothetical protein
LQFNAAFADGKEREDVHAFCSTAVIAGQTMMLMIIRLYHTPQHIRTSIIHPLLLRLLRPCTLETLVNTGTVCL